MGTEKRIENTRFYRLQIGCIHKKVYSKPLVNYEGALTGD